MFNIDVKKKTPVLNPRKPNFSSHRGFLFQGETRKAYWCIWNPQHGIPIRIHLKIEDARKEAEKLARKNPGEKFRILQSVESVYLPGKGFKPRRQSYSVSKTISPRGEGLSEL